MEPCLVFLVPVAAPLVLLGLAWLFPGTFDFS
jgi:hypothetical protein